MKPESTSTLLRVIWGTVKISGIHTYNLKGRPAQGHTNKKETQSIFPSYKNDSVPLRDSELAAGSCVAFLVFSAQEKTVQYCIEFYAKIPVFHSLKNSFRE